jgi:hypothetical protein
MGGSTIADWVKRFGRYGAKYKLMVIQTPDEQPGKYVLPLKVV